MKRPRLTIRRLILLIAIVAAGLFVYREFDEGVPPRFVIRGIPDRIARLKPGMTKAVAEEILGVNRSWILGGTNAKYGMSPGGSNHIFQHYAIGSFRGRATVDVCYYDPTLGYLTPRDDDPPTVVWARFRYDQKDVARMPAQRP